MKTKVIIENPHSKTTLIMNKPMEELKRWFRGGSIVNRDPIVLEYETLESNMEKDVIKDGFIVISAWNCAFISLSEVD